MYPRPPSNRIATDNVIVGGSPPFLHENRIRDSESESLDRGRQWQKSMDMEMDVKI